MLNEKLAQLKKICEEATPGPWEVCPGDGSILTSQAVYGPDKNLKMCVAEVTGRSRPDYEYIAALNPQTATLLIECVEIAMKQLQFAATGHERECNTSFEADYSNMMRLRSARLGAERALSTIAKTLTDWTDKELKDLHDAEKCL